MTYDGLLEPVGESQVVNYVERVGLSWPVTVVSFEKTDLHADPRVHAMHDRLMDAGVSWRPRRYHKRPRWLAKIADIAAGMGECLRWLFAGTSGVSIFHVRGYLPALMALPFRKLGCGRLLFDMRGFWADERVDRGDWMGQSLAYRITKWWERRFFESSDAIVSLTHTAVRSFPELGYHLRADVQVVVVPTCVDVRRFCPAAKDPGMLAILKLAGGPVVGYVGTMSRAYMRGETLRYLALLSRHYDGARVLVVTQEDHARLREDAVAAGIDPMRLVLTRANHSEMPDLVRLMDIGAFFIRPCFSARACAATKLAEFLACGVPVITNAGIGDYADLVGETRTGVVLPAVTSEAFAESLRHVDGVLNDPLASQRCRETAVRYFDVEKAVTRYADLYAHLAGPSRQCPVATSTP